MVNAVKLGEVSSSSSCRLSGCQDLQINHQCDDHHHHAHCTDDQIYKGQSVCHVLGHRPIRFQSRRLLPPHHLSSFNQFGWILRKVSKGIKLYWTFYFILRLYLTVKRHHKAQMSMCPLHIFNVSLEWSFLVQIITKRIFIHQCNTKHSDTSNTIIITNIILLHQKNGNCLKFNFRFTAKIVQSQSLLNYGNDPMSVKKLYFAVLGHSSSVKGREREDN